MAGNTYFRASQESASHWYDRDGKPCHVIPTGGGKYRPTNLADAKRESYLGSVTNYMRVVAKPGLQSWFEDRLLRAAAENPRRKNHDIIKWMSKVREAANSASKDARDLGSKIHHAIENWFEEEVEPADEILPYVLPILEFHDDATEMVVKGREYKVVNLDYGYAGTCDAYGELDDGTPFVLDYKSRKQRSGGKFDIYPSDPVQIAAYAAAIYGEAALDRVMGVNLLISSTDPGKWNMEFYDDLVLPFRVFKAIMQLWVWENGYDPSSEKVWS